MLPCYAKNKNHENFKKQQFSSYYLDRSINGQFQKEEVGLKSITQAIGASYTPHKTPKFAQAKDQRHVNQDCRYDCYVCE